MKKFLYVLISIFCVFLISCNVKSDEPLLPNEPEMPSENVTPGEETTDPDEEKPNEPNTGNEEKPSESKPNESKPNESKPNESKPNNPSQPQQPNESTTTPSNPQPSQPQTPTESSTYPKEWDDNGLFKAYYTKAYNTLKNMTLQEKIEQMLLVRVPSSNATSIIQSHHFGGIVLFARDFKNLNTNQVIQMINNYQKGAKIPLLTAVDEEGGKVVRISSNPLLRATPYQSPQELFQLGGFDKIREDAIDKAKLLKSLKINLLLGPVADVSTNSSDYIYYRTLGQDVNQTSIYIQTVVKALKENNMSMSLKHFPGYGNNKDTHAGIAIDNRTLENFKLNDFLPFQAGIKAGAESILVSHNIITNVENKPASLSKKVHNLLRQDLNFTGVIITDALDMGAISQYVDSDPIIEAVKAGNNLLIVTDYTSAYNSINKGINSKTITESQIDEAVFKTLAWKYYKGLLK